MKRSLLLLICLAHLFTPIGVVTQERLFESSGEQKKESAVVDAFWINILPIRSEHQKPSYFDLQSDGRFVFAEGDDPAIIKTVRSGILPKKFVWRAFQIVNKPSVFKARDTDPGEQIFSDSDWVSVGLVIDGKVKASGGWFYQEELKDFPAEFRKLLAELRSVAVKLPHATNIKALLSGGMVEMKRVELIGRERFIVLDEEAQDRLPALMQAISMSRRMIAVEDETQMRRLEQLARRLNPQSAYWGLYTIRGQDFYEIGAPYLQRSTR